MKRLSAIGAMDSIDNITQNGVLLKGSVTVRDRTGDLVRVRHT